MDSFYCLVGSNKLWSPAVLRSLKIFLVDTTGLRPGEKLKSIQKTEEFLLPRWTEISFCKIEHGAISSKGQAIDGKKVV